MGAGMSGVSLALPSRIELLAAAMDPDRTTPMEKIAAGGPIEIEPFMAFTFGIFVYFIGRDLTPRFPILSAYSIPEPVSGGIIAACLTFAIVWFTGREIEFNLYVRDYLLVYTNVP